MEFLALGTLILGGFLWQCLLIQKLCLASSLWRPVWGQFVISAPLLILLVTIGKLDGGAFAYLAIYLVGGLVVVLSWPLSELRAYPAFCVSFAVPMVFAAIVAMGVALNATFLIMAPPLTVSSSSSIDLNQMVISGLLFSVIFQVKSLVSPMVVCINLAWGIHSYMSRGQFALWDIMQNTLLIIMEPAAAASTAPWYTFIFAVLALIATGWDILRSASDIGN